METRPPAARSDPTLVLAAHEADDGRTELVVENRGRDPVRLAFGAEIEAVEIPAVASDPDTPASEYSIGSQFFFLTEDCSEPIEHGQPSDRCVTLDPGRILHVMPWTGYNATVQCPRGATPSDFPSPAGSYRFVLTSCGGAETYRSDTFSHTNRAAELNGDD